MVSDSSWPHESQHARPPCPSPTPGVYPDSCPSLPPPVFLGFHCGSAGKESACNVGDLGSIPGLGRSPGEGKSYPLQYSVLENSIDCIVHGVTKSWRWLSDFQVYFSINRNMYKISYTIYFVCLMLPITLFAKKCAIGLLIFMFLFLCQSTFAEKAFVISYTKKRW